MTEEEFHKYYSPDYAWRTFIDNIINNKVC